jgi:1-acyl-sn-glycerol-3-phosphate acyltransferase
MDRLAGVVAPLARVTVPEVVGIDRVPDRGALFVGNHTIFGFLDLPFMVSELWTRRGIVVRGLGEHGHYAIPVWRDLLEMCGMVRGTRDNVRALMRQGEHVLVFPGGAGEVFKRRGQKYQLLWKERLGFARLAIEFGYPIVPFAAVGAEEMYDVIADADTPGYRQVSGLMKRLVGLPLPPLARGIGPTLLPRPERLYFRFAEPIDTTRFGGRADDDGAARALRDEVRAAVETGIDELQRVRDADPKRRLAARLRLSAAPDLPTLAQSDPDAWYVSSALNAWNEVGPATAAAWISRRAQLIDPPGWPGAGTWRGRDAVVARLEQVTAELGAGWVELLDLHSVGEDVVGELELRADRRRTPLGRFRLTVHVDEGQIMLIRVAVEGEQE